MRSVMKTAVLLGAFVACVGGFGARAFAQDKLIADVPFKFMLSGKTYDAGKYELRVNNTEQVVELTAPGQKGSFVEAMTRLAEPENKMTEARLVFDKVGDTAYLSEVWLPEQDGYLMFAAKGKHTHHVVKLQRGPKTS